MRALYLTAKPPLPLESGAAIRDWNLLNGLLANGLDVDLITLDGNRPVTPTEAAAMREVVGSLTVLPLNLEGFSTTKSRIMAVAGRPLHGFVGRSPVSAQIAEALASGRYDVVIASQLFMAPAVPKEWLPQTVFDSHNVESQRYRRILGSSTSLPHRIAGLTIPRQIERMEASIVRSFGATLACSQGDATALSRIGGGAKIDVVPNGVVINPLTERSAANPGQVLFLASLDYTPNVDALRVFLEDVLPLLPKEQVKIVVAGSQPTKTARELVAKTPQVTFLPNVPDAGALMRASDVLVVPLLTGGGTRLKVLEAFAAGLPIVGTAIGVEGLNVTNGRQAIVEDTAAGMAAGIEKLLSEPATWASIRQEAYNFAAAEYDWKNISVGFAKVVTQVGEKRAKS